MGIKEVWEVFKQSSMQDKDMQAAMRKASTTNACIGLLEENEQLEQRIAELEEQLAELEEAKRILSDFPNATCEHIEALELAISEVTYPFPVLKPKK